MELIIEVREVDIKDVDLNNAYFHFTSKDNAQSIEENGLKAQVGDASRMVGDKPRVCLSKGGKGALGAKNSFIHEFKKLKICDIPEGYRKYFDIIDYASTESVRDEDVYIAMERRFKDEVYLQVDAIEGEDFLQEEVYGLNSEYDIKGKENHDIDPEKLSLITTQEGSSAFDIVEQLYNRLLENAEEKGKENVVRETLSDLTSMFEYIRQRDSAEQNPGIAVPKGMRIFRYMSAEEFKVFLSGEKVEGKFFKGYACFINEKISARRIVTQKTDESSAEIDSEILEFTVPEFMSKVRSPDVTADILVEFETTEHSNLRVKEELYMEYAIDELHTDSYDRTTLNCVAFTLDFIQGFQGGRLDKGEEIEFLGYEDALEKLEEVKERQLSEKNQAEDERETAEEKEPMRESESGIDASPLIEDDKQGYLVSATDIGKATINSPTALKKEAEGVEARTKAQELELENGGEEYNGE